jgi:hypothetical protein
MRRVRISAIDNPSAIGSVKMNKINKIVIAMTTICASQMGLAQGSKPEAAMQLEEIMVTARRTEEKINEVPVSITAFTAPACRLRATPETPRRRRYFAV